MESINNLDSVDNDLLGKQAETLKEKGNQEYSRNLWPDANRTYSEAIDLLKHSEVKAHKSLISILYCNRSAANIQMLNYSDALEDAKLSISNDIEFAKAYLRAGDCCIGLKRFKEAKEFYLKCIVYIKVDPNDKTMNAHNIMLTNATNALNNSKMKMFYEPILRGNDAHYGKLDLKYQDKVMEKSLIARVDIKKGEIIFTDLPYSYQISPQTLMINSEKICKHCMSFVLENENRDRFTGDNLTELQEQYQPLVDLLKEAYGLKKDDSIQYKIDTILKEEFDKLFSISFYDSILGMINFNVLSTVVRAPEPTVVSKSIGSDNSKSKSKNKKVGKVAEPVQPKIFDSWGIGLYPIFSCMNHSCQPNVEICNERTDGVTFNKVVFRAKKNIKAGQELLNNYCDVTLPTKERQSQLKSQYDFICKCNKCH
ncbi:hypothetical protein PPL_05877 [Heterostelium album PN500]|uniref:SET domain-containing protein n=1 Tax=Heterostelium pallidum (strain ATCC 26659 / Pp 5 / PN500) TaxID=670386 RepID=D3BBK9_HETP5|nr:hypothetical protein PPL_05877 [Heterostelium album PN500]EFA81042.1 hypothetical protein PPL_05877 [Heterostelium album PN500]|eukprot:XP_020433160.1 hypothetical protein PPL_05877 [Heterostelium album PN500]